MPPLWHCDWDSCELPSVRRAGDCLLCNRHFCRTHLQNSRHTCPDPMNDWPKYSAQYAASESQRLDEMRQRINVTKLCSRASQLYADFYVACTVDLSRKTLSKMMGGQNCHAEIRFEDGGVWIARFRLSNAGSPPPATRDYILRSEAASMLFLQKNTRVPSPRVFDWACESDAGNDIGVGYILMEKMPGTSLDWQGATDSQKEKVTRQLVDIMLEIEKHPLDKFGSLVIGKPDSVDLNAAEFEMGGLADHSTSRSSATGGPLGPFSSLKNALQHLVKAYTKMIANGEIGTFDNRLDVYLAHRFRLDLLNEAFNSDDMGAEQF